LTAVLFKLINLNILLCSISLYSVGIAFGFEMHLLVHALGYIIKYSALLHSWWNEDTLYYWVCVTYM